MNNVVLSVGSNSPDRQWQMESVIRYIESMLKNVCSSSIYETLALNGKDAPYLNAVIVADTDMSIDDAKKFFKQWEALCGRNKVSKLKGVIPIDIDIVVWNGAIIREGDFFAYYFSQGYYQLLSLGKIKQFN